MCAGPDLIWRSLERLDPYDATGKNQQRMEMRKWGAEEAWLQPRPGMPGPSVISASKQHVPHLVCHSGHGQTPVHSLPTSHLGVCLEPSSNTPSVLVHLGRHLIR